MLETSGLPPQTEPPEAPDLIQWWRWFIGYFAREGKVIKEAKVTFGAAALVLIAASAWLTWKAAGALYEERLASKDATISTKDANIEYLKAQMVCAETDLPKTTEVQQSARLEIALQYVAPTADKALAINLYFTNKGTLPSSQPVHEHLSVYTNKVLDDAEVDQIFVQLFRNASVILAHTKIGGNQIYPNQNPTYWTDFEFYDDAGKPIIIDETKYKTIIDGDMRLYTFALLYYRDCPHRRKNGGQLRVAFSY